ncbi:Hypothetical_protein [Hexamita inflata]|uniref:Hypothetical_protein n=1 Tax=Hexamita inflata TaxID=28002 RepID=A0AA86NL37_9EUKA|nr:Hypothetical protein HINF_LOCUS9535 [Hexamita inflata]
MRLVYKYSNNYKQQFLYFIQLAALHLTGETNRSQLDCSGACVRWLKSYQNALKSEKIKKRLSHSSKHEVVVIKGSCEELIAIAIFHINSGIHWSFIRINKRFERRQVNILQLLVFLSLVLMFVNSSWRALRGKNRLSSLQPWKHLSLVGKLRNVVWNLSKKLLCQNNLGRTCGPWTSGDLKSQVSLETTYSGQIQCSQVTYFYWFGQILYNYNIIKMKTLNNIQLQITATYTGVIYQVNKQYQVEIVIRLLLVK